MSSRIARWLPVMLIVTGCTLGAQSAHAGQQNYVYCPDDGCAYGPGTTSRGDGHSTHVYNNARAHYNNHDVRIREFTVDSNERTYEVNGLGTVVIEHPKSRTYPSCRAQTENNHNVRMKACSAVWAEGGGERAAAEPVMTCGDRNAEEYPSIATGALATTAVGASHLKQPRVDSNRLPHVTASPADRDRDPAGAPAWVEAVPTADAMTHPEAECAFGLLPITTTMRGDTMWTGRLADGVGCLIVRRPDDVLLRTCGGDAATPGFVSYAAGESNRADVYILAPEGAKSFELGGTELPVTGGVAVAYGVDQAVISELTR